MRKAVTVSGWAHALGSVVVLAANQVGSMDELTRRCDVRRTSMQLKNSPQNIPKRSACARWMVMRSIERRTFMPAGCQIDHGYHGDY